MEQTDPPADHTPRQADRIAYEPPEACRPASAAPTEAELERESPGGIRSQGHDPYAALQYPDYRRYLAGSIVSVIGQQMLAVAVGWELYERTSSATVLGLVGLVQALPIIVLALPAGYVADHFDRKRVVLACLVLIALSAAGLAFVSYRHEAIPQVGAVRASNIALARLATLFGETGTRFDDPSVPLVLLLLFIAGVAYAFSDPARSAFLPRIVPMSAFSNAVTWSSSGFQVASMVGPAFGGLVVGYLGGHAYNYAVAYLAEGLCAGCMFVCILPLAGIGKPPAAERAEGENRGGSLSLSSLGAGMGFVWRTKLILATITLDMFAVLLGGATALLPIFARDILHSGATGLGWLRASPSIGALAMALALAHLPPMQRAGKTLLWAVAGFGMATIVFGLSRSFWLSFAMLAVAGALDNISVVIRHTLVQALTPDALRGRVSAINYVFIGTSNEIGAFESGITAAMFGPVLSVVGGGVGTIVVVLAVALIWPQVARFGRLDSLDRPD